MKRGGPLKPGKGFAPRSTPMARGTATLARSPMKRAAKPKAEPAAAVEKRVPAKRGRGLKGRPPTAAERAFMDQAGKVPCLACTKDGRENRHVSLHHVDGRTKPGAHFLVLPLCAPHHQPDDTDPLERVALHGSKKVFGQMYGTERELLAELYRMLNFTPPGAAPCP
jgi:hypothetical protein